MTNQDRSARTLSRRHFLALGGGVLATATLGACAAPTAIGPGSPLVARTEQARRVADARVVSRTLTAAPATVDLGGVQVQTWAYDGRLPGPEIRLARDQVLRVQLRNTLPRPTTVHWHGIALRNDMDGVPDLNQPPIARDSTFTYEFAAPHAGTYFFHPHVGTQLDRGLYAPLIVTDPDEPGDHDVEAVFVLDDWLDGVAGDPDQELERLGSEGMGMGGMGMGGMGMGGMDMGGGDPMAPLGSDTGDVTYPHYLINGRIGADPITFTATPGQRLRLRIINAGSDTAFRVALGGHRMTVTHTDGFPVQPTETGCLLIAMGERYDVTVTLADGVFPLAAAAEGKDGQGFALVRTASGDAPAADVRPIELDTAPLVASRLRATDAVLLPAREPDRTHTLELGMDMSGYRWTINGQVYGEHEPLPMRSGERIRLRFVNNTMMFHPMHLHGHTYQVGAAGPRKDTSIVLPMQTLDVDFDGDNPGQWMVHCHNVYHGEAGMMTVLSYTG